MTPRERILKAARDSKNPWGLLHTRVENASIAAAVEALRIAREHVRTLEEKMAGHDAITGLGLTSAGRGYHAAAQNIGNYLDDLLSDLQGGQHTGTCGHLYGNEVPCPQCPPDLVETEPRLNREKP